MLILRLINRNGIHYNFRWPLEAGAIVECPDWDPEPKCGNGLHGLPEGRGEWVLFDGHYWAVIEADEEDIVTIDDSKCKFRRGLIKAICDPDRESVRDFLMEHMPDLFRTAKDREAFWLGWKMGDRDVMRDRVTDSRHAYFWAKMVGDCDVMRDRVIEPYWAYRWALRVGDRDVMWPRVKDYHEYVEQWKENIGEPSYVDTTNDKP